jgi:hypothetical protein
LRANSFGGNTNSKLQAIAAGKRQVKNYNKKKET